MLRNFKLVIEYDGTAYHGWQRQKGVQTIQGVIEGALTAMTGQAVTLTGSGRTDAGVHALNQVANFLAHTGLSPHVFQKGLNSMLPEDVVIRECQEVDASFHARYDCVGKIYDYHIVNRPIRPAISRQYAWHIRKTLDLSAMRAAMICLRGKHDFAAFQASGSSRAHSVRTMSEVGLTAEGDSGRLVFSMEADGFLRCMVRNIVGTLVDVGLGRTSPEAFRDILGSKDRKRAGATAPPCGLFLREVKYGSCPTSGR